jgi:hypothetical protein
MFGPGFWEAMMLKFPREPDGQYPLLWQLAALQALQTIGEERGVEIPQAIGLAQGQWLLQQLEAALPFLIETEEAAQRERAAEID